MDNLDSVMEQLQEIYADLNYYMDSNEDELSEEDYDIIVTVSAHIEYAMDKLDPLTDTE